MANMFVDRAVLRMWSRIADVTIEPGCVLMTRSPSDVRIDDDVVTPDGVMTLLEALECGAVSIAKGSADPTLVGAGLVGVIEDSPRDRDVARSAPIVRGGIT